MVYSTDAAKWRAYQFLDPFAAGSFYVCNKINKYFCRPDCDAHPSTELRLEIKFVPSVADAVELGYVPCESCDPLVVPPIDVELLVATVREINALIGFVPPAMDDEDDAASRAAKNLDAMQPRRLLVPAINYSQKYGYTRDTAVLKNDNEHFRLVDLACRHLALAAALSVFATNSPSSSPKHEALSPDAYPGKKSRKRRGGVLGFKELAAKLKLSAWHFHRVFKSVTGLTPKTYGDKCYELLQAKHLDAKSSVSASDSPHSLASVPQAGSADAASKYSSPALSVALSALPMAGQKRVRIDDDYAMPHKAVRVATPVFTPFNELSGFDEEYGPSLDLDSRATSAPDLTAFNFRPQSLFSHSKPMDFASDLAYADGGMPLQMNAPQQPVMPMVGMMEPMAMADELLGTFADMFAAGAAGDELLPMQLEVELADNFSFGLLPELLTTNAGF